MGIAIVGHAVPDRIGAIGLVAVAGGDGGVNTGHTAMKGVVVAGAHHSRMTMGSAADNVGTQSGLRGAGTAGELDMEGIARDVETVAGEEGLSMSPEDASPE